MNVSRGSLSLGVKQLICLNCTILRLIINVNRENIIYRTCELNMFDKMHYKSNSLLFNDIIV